MDSAVKRASSAEQPQRRRVRGVARSFLGRSSAQLCLLRASAVDLLAFAVQQGGQSMPTVDVSKSCFMRGNCVGTLRFAHPTSKCPTAISMRLFRRFCSERRMDSAVKRASSAEQPQRRRVRGAARSFLGRSSVQLCLLRASAVDLLAFAVRQVGQSMPTVDVSKSRFMRGNCVGTLCFAHPT